MTPAIENATEIGMSANAKDFHATIQWIQLQKAKGNGEFHLPNGKLYPFLHIEESSIYDAEIIKAYKEVRHNKTAFEAMKAYNEWDVADLCTGAGGNHIYFKLGLGFSSRIAIIYFDPYEI